MARGMREEYRKSAKKGKSNMSRDLVQAIRDLTPPGRFIKRNPVTNAWEDVGDDIAREKVSQVLRDAVSEYCGPKAEKKKQKSGSGSGSDDDDEEGSGNESDNNNKSDQEDDRDDKVDQAKDTTKSSKDVAPKEEKVTISVPAMPAAAPAVPVVSATVPAPLPIFSEPLPDPALELEQAKAETSSDENILLGESPKIFVSDDSFPLVVNATAATSEESPATSDMSASSKEDHEEPTTTTKQSTSTTAATGISRVKRSFKASATPVQCQPVPWSRINKNKRKTNLLDRYAGMGISTTDMSIGSMASSQQLSSRQLMSSGARQMSSRQLSKRQIMNVGGSRQNSRRQLSQRQLSEMSLLSLDSLSISGHGSLMSFGKPRSRKNVLMEQYKDMDMGLSDISLGSLAGVSAHCGNTHNNGMGGPGHAARPSVIIEGDLEEGLSEHSKSSHVTLTLTRTTPQDLLTEQYAAVGMGTSTMTMNTIGTFSGHSRRGLFGMAPSVTGTSMRMDSGHTFLTNMDDLQLDMLDDECFEDYADYTNQGQDYEDFDEEDEEEEVMSDDDEFCSEFC